jgi:Ca2+/Na+ antiporter
MVGIILGSIFIVLVLLLVLAFCIRKKKKDTGARTPRGSLSVGTNNGRFSFLVIVAPNVIFPL